MNGTPQLRRLTDMRLFASHSYETGRARVSGRWCACMQHGGLIGSSGQRCQLIEARQAAFSAQASVWPVNPDTHATDDVRARRLSVGSRLLAQRDAEVSARASVSSLVRSRHPSQDEGYVNVGIDHDTAQFAVNSIRSWWEHLGAERPS